MVEIMEARENKTMKKILLILNLIMLSIGTCGCPLIARLYFIHGGKRVWLSSFLQTAGFPIILIPLGIGYLRRKRRRTDPNRVILMKPPLFVASAMIGILTGFDDYLYAYGLAWLPVSTSSLILATQLVFTAGFAFLLVKQRFTSYSTNAVVLLTIGAAVLALHTSGDRPTGESKKNYLLGFLMTLAASALYGFILPLVELTYKKARQWQPVTYTLVLEIQFVISLFATLFCTIGMLINNDFKVISREAREYEEGETKYYVVLVLIAIICQNFFLGSAGVIFSASSLLCGIMIAVLLPVTEILAVIFYKEKFQAEKGVSLALSIWGFVSYFYGEFRQTKTILNPDKDLELPQIPSP